jgi:rhamnulokinase
MPINTIFQLAAHDRDELARARQLVMLPELVAYELTGEDASERSNAGTTGLLEVETGAWAADLAEAIGVDPELFPPAEAAGRQLGEYRGTPVHLVAAHDTACAFAASPLDDAGHAVVSAGTWFLARERRHVRSSPRGKLLQRGWSRGRLPLPQERHRLLASRAVRARLGHDH